MYLFVIYLGVQMFTSKSHFPFLCLMKNWDMRTIKAYQPGNKITSFMDCEKFIHASFMTLHLLFELNVMCNVTELQFFLFISWLLTISALDTEIRLLE